MNNVESTSGYKRSLITIIQNMNDAIECCKFFGIHPASFLAERQRAVATLARIEQLENNLYSQSNRE